MRLGLNESETLAAFISTNHHYLRDQRVDAYDDLSLRYRDPT